jgi:ElaB/YqjD/DUF883 family membrane-anchored ribosome-binding protein
MENETDVTREQMDETRASMSEKMESLEQKVVDSAHDAANIVGQAVDNVKDAMHDTVENVKDAVDLPLQVSRHPWAIVGGSIAVGFLGGYLLFRHAAPQPSANAKSSPVVPDGPRFTEPANGVVKGARISEEAFAKKPAADVAPPASHQPSWLGRMHDRFGAEIETVKGLAIGAVMGVARDMITQSSSEKMKVALADVIDGITVKMGGEPLHAPATTNGVHANGAGKDETSPTKQQGIAAQESGVKSSVC